MSLTESCIVLVIASSCMIVATPSLIRARDAYILKAAARDVASKLYLARISAITRNRDCRIRVTSSTSYTVECQESTWQSIDSATLPRGITITANARPEFHRRGNVSPAATISVWDSNGRSVRVVVNINGRLRIQ